MKAETNRGPKVDGADVSADGVLVHFSDGLSVLYMAHFLHAMRYHDGNIAIPNDADGEDERVAPRPGKPENGEPSGV